MSESTTLREAIAEAIFNGEFTGVARDTLATLWAAEVGNFGDDTVWHNQADAVLAVLADLPDDVIEPVAALSDPDAVNYPKDSLTYGLAMRLARKALAAVFGGEQE